MGSPGDDTVLGLPVNDLCIQVLTDELPKLLAGLSFKKSMRWRGETAFSRPVRWLLALHGQTVVPAAWAGLRAGAATRLLRNADQPEAQVRHIYALFFPYSPSPPFRCSISFALRCRHLSRSLVRTLACAARNAGVVAGTRACACVGLASAWTPWQPRSPGAPEPRSYRGVSDVPQRKGSRAKTRAWACVSLPQVASAADYLPTLSRGSIVLDQEARKQAIWQQVTAAAAEAGGERSEPPALLRFPLSCNPLPSPALGGSAAHPPSSPALMP